MLDVPGPAGPAAQAALARAERRRGGDADRVAVRVVAAVRLRRDVHVRGRHAQRRAARGGAGARPRPAARAARPGGAARPDRPGRARARSRPTCSGLSRAHARRLRRRAARRAAPRRRPHARRGRRPRARPARTPTAGSSSSRGERRAVRAARRRRAALDRRRGRRPVPRRARASCRRAGCPEAFLDDVPDALRAARAPLRAHARAVRGARRCATATASTSRRVLAALERAGELVRGELRPGGTEREWCDPEVLRRLRRASLAALRKEIEPADQRALARFLPSWQGVDRHPPAGAGHRPAARGARPAAGPRAARRRVGARRAAAPRRRLLAGAGSTSCARRARSCGSAPARSGARSGRVALYFREDAALLGPPPASIRGDRPRTRVHERDPRPPARGRVLLHRPARRPRRRPAEEIQEALWDLVWAGEVTNDAFAPLRSPRAARRRGRSSARAERARRRRFGARRARRAAARSRAAGR